MYLFLNVASVTPAVFDEVKESDSESGGSIQVAIINRDGFKQLSPREVWGNYREFVNVITNGFAQLVRAQESGIPNEYFRKMLPKP